MLPETDPLGGPLLFFALQAVGVVGEGVVRGWLRGKERWRHGVPRSVKEAFTFVWVAGWMYYTAPLVVDDFSKGGIWLFEPVPFSLLRALGYGEEGDSRLWRWRGRNVFWYTGDRWWKSGIAV